ncbi:E3 ubiquitin-protein ligase SHPRH-like [Polyodon spathula]|uniref:E3 ubiquitin-protein ligase SHPRH-like n=1 Tax=Polyodon spathula TaxID=7913 RepID=UPI001B7DFBC9|nr:E3 ubiquitin-protein ligase SHPRH-like [Polyodon spathula]
MFLFLWSHPVLTCEHYFCNECIAIIVEQYSTGIHRRAIKCAICRQTTSHKEISYVFTAETTKQDEEISVKANCCSQVSNQINRRGKNADHVENSRKKPRHHLHEAV